MVACGFTLMVSVEVELVVVVTGLGEKLAVTLEGTPETLRVTELLAPTAVTLTVAFLLDLRLTVIDVGETEIPKSAGAVTFSETVVEWVASPLIVIVEEATGVLEVVVMVRVELPGAVTEVGLTAQVVFAGHPETLKGTDPANPPSEPTVMVEVFPWPCWIDKDDGLAESE